MSQLLSYPKNKIKVVLVEKIHEAASEVLRESGYSVELIPKALDGEELDKVAAEAHVLGVRSRTKLRAVNLEKAKRLLAVGCFSVGTDQVDLGAAASKGVPVFNAPYSSTRSVAELTIGNIISLARRVGDKNRKLHHGVWDKSLAGAEEVRDKVVGIVGYGHIGQQVSILAEAIGMQVVFYDVLRKLPLGRARSVSSLETLLATADFVTLHVPGTALTKGMIGKAQFAQMKAGRYLLNLSRGSVVDLQSLAESLQSKHLAGAAIDVFPEEPIPAEAEYSTVLAELPNVILTPHIGGNTEEAQRNIGIEVAQALTGFIDHGITEGTVNFPAINLPTREGSHRILNVHKNVPGALLEINKIVSEVGANIEAQQLGTWNDIGYLVMDLNRDLSEEVRSRIAALTISIKTRILF